MSKPFVFKARLKVADLFHHANHIEVFTAAVAKRESLEHFLLRILGFCALSYNQRTFLNQKSDKSYPDVWCENDEQKIVLALYVSELDISEITRLCKLYNRLLILTIDGEHWYKEVSSHLIQHHNISIFSIKASFLEDLKTNLTNSMHWDILIEQNSMSVSDKSGYYQTEVKQLC
ncbi:hypothetical protein C1E24_13700 [Pseudoalteromonas phenolica]|uniref:YaeQ family protein n=1 Tax=Pseudoalteromonas phenolica TaxID=161398 RepID=A0A5R9Q206_9GAMM|nr:YaeQ family protein [Pseudoalteromonas phenolica]TLX46417.1 hypothetical protein C1E24_13700 [Pseudoalteromonas phenolica]